MRKSFFLCLSVIMFFSYGCAAVVQINEPISTCPDREYNEFWVRQIYSDLGDSNARIIVLENKIKILEGQLNSK